MQNKVFIDTNIFLRFLISDKTNPELSEKAKKVFLKLSKEEITLQTNLLVIAEVVYVLEKYYEMSKTDIQNVLMPILSIPNLIINEKEKILASLNVFDEKNVDFEDAYTYFDMISLDILSIVTFDEKHFKRFGNIEILTDVN